jgi:hypothetical protein
VVPTDTDGETADDDHMTAITITSEPADTERAGRRQTRRVAAVLLLLHAAALALVAAFA